MAFVYTPRDAEERKALLKIEGVSPGPDGTVAITAMSLAHVLNLAEPEGAVGRPRSPAALLAAARRPAPVVRMGDGLATLAPRKNRE